MTRTGWRDVAVCLALVVLVLGAFYRVVGHDFVAFDDNWYILHNSVVRAGLTKAGLVLAFTKSYATNWHPVTWVSHMLDVELFGLDPRGHHAVSLVLHAGNTVLLFLALRLLTLRTGPSFFAAALFGIHPLHVESVAWVAERKDVLCGFFWMLTLIAYARYVKAPGWRGYLLVCSACALCLLSKPMGVTLPLVLLLLDGWPLGRLWCCPDREGGALGPAQVVPLRRLLGEKLPLLLLVVLASFLTLVAQAKGGAVASVDRVPLDSRFANAALAYWGYLGKTLWPVDLSVFYPRGNPSLADGSALLGVAGLLAITAAAWRLRRRMPYMLMGWLWYLLTLLPVIGLVQVGEQAMADRYTYLPLVGPFVALAWGVADGAVRWPGVRWLLPWAAGAMVLALSVVTWHQTGHWQNTATLFTHALRVTERNWLAHNSYGVVLLKQGQIQEAMVHFEESLRIQPEHLEAQLNHALGLRLLGRQEEAVDGYRKILAANPGLAKVHHDVGTLFEELGREGEAEAEYAAALRIRDDTLVRQRLGALLLRQKRFAEAAAQFAVVVQRLPRLAEPRNSLGVALAEAGRIAEAVDQFEEALRLDPGYREARLNLAALRAPPGAGP